MHHRSRVGSVASSSDPAVRWLLSAWMHREGVTMNCPATSKPGSAGDNTNDIQARRCAAAIGMLAAQHTDFGARNAPALVIVPASALPAWAAAFARWAPELNVVEYAGSAVSRHVVQEHEWSHRRAAQQKEKEAQQHLTHLAHLTHPQHLPHLQAELARHPWVQAETEAETAAGGVNVKVKKEKEASRKEAARGASADPGESAGGSGSGSGSGSGEATNTTARAGPKDGERCGLGLTHAGVGGSAVKGSGTSGGGSLADVQAPARAAGSDGGGGGGGSGGGSGSGSGCDGGGGGTGIGGSNRDMSPSGNGGGQSDGDNAAAVAAARRPKFHVLLASHAAAAQDLLLLRQVAWETLMLVEEGDATQRSGTMSMLPRIGSLQSANRVLMLNTPMPHTIGELLTILDFIKQSPEGMLALERHLLGLEDAKAFAEASGILDQVTLDLSILAPPRVPKHQLHHQHQPFPGQAQPPKGATVAGAGGFPATVGHVRASWGHTQPPSHAAGYKLWNASGPTREAPRASQPESARRPVPPPLYDSAHVQPHSVALQHMAGGDAVGGLYGQMVRRGGGGGDGGAEPDSSAAADASPAPTAHQLQMAPHALVNGRHPHHPNPTNPLKRSLSVPTSSEDCDNDDKSRGSGGGGCEGGGGGVLRRPKASRPNPPPATVEQGQQQQQLRRGETRDYPGLSEAAMGPTIGHAAAPAPVPSAAQAAATAAAAAAAAGAPPQVQMMHALMTTMHHDPTAAMAMMQQMQHLMMATQPPARFNLGAVSSQQLAHAQGAFLQHMMAAGGMTGGGAFAGSGIVGNPMQAAMAAVVAAAAHANAQQAAAAAAAAGASVSEFDPANQHQTAGGGAFVDGSGGSGGGAAVKRRGRGPAKNKGKKTGGVRTSTDDDEARNGVEGSGHGDGGGGSGGSGSGGSGSGGSDGDHGGSNSGGSGGGGGSGSGGPGGSGGSGSGGSGGSGGSSAMKLGNKNKFGAGG